MRQFLASLCIVTATCGSALAQTDSLMDMLGGNTADQKKEPVTNTFKATRIVNSSSVENLGAGVLDFRISHRFGSLDQGSENFYGLDNATTRLGLDYGITPWLMIGIAHNTFNKENDGFAKIKILKQKKHGMPITLSYAGSISVQTTPAPNIPAADSTKWFFSNRLYYTNQLLIARKFSDRISLQIMPTLVHYNIVDSTKFSNNTIAIGIGGRIKLTKRIALTGEYFYRVTNADLLVSGQKTYNSLSIGVDIETGGHVFQLMITNSQGLTDRTSVGQTTDSWEKGALHIGFNISRVFTIVKPKEFRKSGGAGW
jgi:opacity protein-like surface antigen